MAKLVSDWANIRIILLSASIYRYIFAIDKQNEFPPRPKRRFDKHLILYASVKVWKALFETVKIQYKKKRVST